LYNVQNKHFVDTFIQRQIEGSLRLKLPSDSYQKELLEKLHTYLEFYQATGSTPLEINITNCVYAVREAYVAGLIEEEVRLPNFDILNKMGLTYDEDNKILSRINGEKVQIWPSKRNDLITIGLRRGTI
jgi:hypothetical protein